MEQHLEWIQATYPYLLVKKDVPYYLKEDHADLQARSEAVIPGGGENSLDTFKLILQPYKENSLAARQDKSSEKDDAKEDKIAYKVIETYFKDGDIDETKDAASLCESIVEKLFENVMTFVQDDYIVPSKYLQLGIDIYTKNTKVSIYITGQFQRFVINPDRLQYRPTAYVKAGHVLLPDHLNSDGYKPFSHFSKVNISKIFFSSVSS